MGFLFHFFAGCISDMSIHLNRLANAVMIQVISFKICYCLESILINAANLSYLNTTLAGNSHFSPTKTVIHNVCPLVILKPGGPTRYLHLVERRPTEWTLATSVTWFR